jgi:hypothetical protein
MKRLVLLLILSISLNEASAQIGYNGDYFNMEWGERARFRGDVERILNVNHRSFTIVVNRPTFFGSLFPNSRRLIYREVAGLTPGSQGKIRLRGNGKKVVATDVIDLGSDIVTIAQRQRFGGQNQLFYHQFNPKSVFGDVEGKQVISYFLPVGLAPMKQMGLVTSEDFSKAAAYYTIPVRQGDFPGFGYVILDQGRGEMSSATVQLPYVNFQMELYDQFLSNTGDLYVLGKEYYRNNPSMPWGPENRYFAKLRAFRVVEGKFQEFEINHGMLIQDIKMSAAENGNFICSGFYADDVWSGVRGVFMMEIDRNTNALVKVNKQPFTMEFLSAGVAAWERSFRDRIRANSARQQGLGNFRVLDFRKTGDGGYLGISEHQDIEWKMRVSGEGENQKVNWDQHFYYDDLIVYKLDENGQLQWAKRIPKSQESKNDGGYYLSVAHAVTPDRAFLYFNDNKRNYQPDGSYGNAEFPFEAAFIGNWNVIGAVEIDLKTGEMKRRMLPGRGETRSTFVPKYSRHDYTKNEMVIYAKNGRRHRFGLVTMR